MLPSVIGSPGGCFCAIARPRFWDKLILTGSEMILFRQCASNVTSASIGGRLNEPSSCAYDHD